MQVIYTNAKPLECSSFPNLHRQLGITVRRYASGHLDLECQIADLTVNGSGFGRGLKTLDEAALHATQGTEHIIEHLDTVIAELTAHRARLQTALDELYQRSFAAIAQDQLK